MFFQRRKSNELSIPQLSLGGSTIEFVEHFKFLGIHISNDLNFIHHINHVIGKLNSANHVLIKSRHFLPYKYLKMLFEAIGMSHINFGSIIYLHLCKQRDFNRLSSRNIDCGRTILFHRKG